MQKCETDIWEKPFHWNDMNNVYNKSRISVKNVHFGYNEQKEILTDVTFSAQSGDVYGLYGNNGSGKSTLLKIISGLMQPTFGSVNIEIQDRTVSHDSLRLCCGYSAPYIALYDEFTLFELCQYMSSIRGIPFSEDVYNSLVYTAQLKDREHQLIKYYSSGMQQRAKLVLAVIHKPNILFLDEPTSNLDELGIEFVCTIIEEIRNRNGIVCIATNELREKVWCNKNIYLTATHN